MPFLSSIITNQVSYAATHKISAIWKISTFFFSVLNLRSHLNLILVTEKYLTGKNHGNQNPVLYYTLFFISNTSFYWASVLLNFFVDSALNFSQVQLNRCKHHQSETHFISTIFVSCLDLQSSTKSLRQTLVLI